MTDQEHVHIWMRRQEPELRRVLTLDDIPDELFVEYGLHRGGAHAVSYRCTDPQAVLVPVAEIMAPVRKLNPDALQSLLRGIRDGDDLPPIVVFREPEAATGGVARWSTPFARLAGVGLRVDTGDAADSRGRRVGLPLSTPFVTVLAWAVWTRLEVALRRHLSRARVVTSCFIPSNDV